MLLWWVIRCHSLITNKYWKMQGQTQIIFKWGSQSIIPVIFSSAGKRFYDHLAFAALFTLENDVDLRVKYWNWKTRALKPFLNPQRPCHGSLCPCWTWLDWKHPTAFWKVSSAKSKFKFKLSLHISSENYSCKSMVSSGLQKGSRKKKAKLN